MLRQTWRNQYCWALFSLLCCVFFANIIATPTSASNETDHSIQNNFNCPEDCQCLIPAVHHEHNTDHHFLHAKCKSFKGLTSEKSIKSTLPIHSIDLSYLSLTRLSNSLEKLHDLTSIDLSHNELHEIGHLGRRIKKLNLKHNRITSSKLSKLPQHIQNLNLQHNDISYLPLEFTQLSQLQTLDLSHNPINCSCETLEVRNWLQERHIFMESAVKCSYPVEVKGMSWLQVKQTDICAKEKSHDINWEVDENENELMFGDQPAIEESGDFNDEDEIGKDYMPVEHKSRSSRSNEIEQPSDVEGSGDLSNSNLPLQATTSRTNEDELTTVADEENDDGSGGSGGGIVVIPSQEDNFDKDDSPVTYTSVHNHDDEINDNKPIEEPASEATQSPPVFFDMGIFNPSDEISSTGNPVTEDVIVPAVHNEVGEGAAPIDTAVITEKPGVSTEGPEKGAAVMQAKVSDDNDSNATYFLLGVIVLIVAGLILFVGIKRCKKQRNARHDAENPRQTELLDMDKKNLGKPLHKENAPLIGDKSKADLAKPINGAGKKSYDASDVKDGSTQDQPLLKNGSGNGAAPKDANETNIQPVETTAPNQLAPHEYYPITPRYPTPKSPRASKYAQYPPGGGENNNNSPNANDAYLTSSPKSGRYSPVYSPETGRVKIKLTETPKPKTPMLVTRSKSNAGDIITTPVHAGGINGTPAVAIHTGTNGHATGHY